ncbi:serine hydrolase domain-containing protein [Sphaerisporangium fuscum]|uniref:serine hydrolase domain-containing protein n=1 Tax=Sphaerisporangium fuscum TaxID=2835868 RepID=UPI001BDCEDA0|nr:serine hydrolase domain-containing protein [Sphaerisporangium fuscum]
MAVLSLSRSLTAAAGAVLCVVAAATAVHASPGRDPAALQRRLDRIVREDRIPGILITVTEPGPHGRQATLRAGTGDLRTGRPVPPDGRVRIGSVTKAFVATVVMQLAGEGGIGLDTPVERYLPGVVRGRGGDGRVITIRQLLQHTSGLPDPGDLLPHDEKFARHRFDHHDRDELIRHALGKRPTFAPPGAAGKWSYTNTGYLLLGMVVEKVTGAKDWRDEVRRRIVVPLRLRGTSLPRPGSYGIPGPHPHGYIRVASGLADVTEQDTGHLDAAGGMISTPGDVNRFFTALLRGELLRPAQLAQMTRMIEAAPGGAVERYGLGLERNELSCGGFVGHSGQMHGYSTAAGLLVDRAGRLGRAVTMTITTEPRDLEEFHHLMKVVDTALCGPRPSPAAS